MKSKNLNIGVPSGWDNNWMSLSYSGSEWYTDVTDTHKNCDVDHNLMSFDKILLEDNSLQLVYCSHTIEHLTYKYVEALFSETYRMLEKGGTFRVMTIDADLIYKKYKDKTLHTYRTFWELNSRVNELLTILMHNITDKKITHPLYFRTEEEALEDSYYITQEEFDSKLEEQGFYATMDELYDLQESFAERNQYKYSGNHISWWTSEKIIDYLKKAGFKDIEKSTVRGSTIPEMRKANFDTTRSNWSVIIEAKK